MEIRIEALGQGDAALAAKLEKEAFNGNAWTQKDFEDTLKLDYSYYVGAKIDGELVGMAGASLIAGDAYISNVSVRKNLRREGIGLKLMGELMELLKAKGALAYTLEVRSKNTAAINLYKKMGFETEGIRKDFYSEPADDALIMWKR